MEEAPVQKASILIVGTSHVAQQSADRIKRAAHKFQPDIIAIELDAGRLDALKEKAAGKKDGRIPLSMIRQVGVTGYLFVILGRALQKRIGDVLNVQPGLDMLTAVDIAHNEKKQLFLVDQDMVVTMRRLSQKFTFREKMRVFKDVLVAPFSKKKVDFDLSKVPDDHVIEELLKQLKGRYPNIYHVLIIERNIVMAKNLDAIVRKNPGKRILLVIGAGHGADLRARLGNLERLATIE